MSDTSLPIKEVLKEFGANGLGGWLPRLWICTTDRYTSKSNVPPSEDVDRALFFLLTVGVLNEYGENGYSIPNTEQNRLLLDNLGIYYHIQDEVQL